MKDWTFRVESLLPDILDRMRTLDNKVKSLLEEFRPDQIGQLEIVQVVARLERTFEKMMDDRGIPFEHWSPILDRFFNDHRISGDSAAFDILIATQATGERA